MSANLETVRESLTAFYTQLDINTVASTWADSCEFVILPESLGIKSMNKEEHVASTTQMIGNMKEYTSWEIIELFASGDKVTGHVRSNAALKDGVEFKADSIFIFTFNKEGNIILFKQFVDSLALSKLRGNLTA
ncbi:hypothetical protein DL96DRAFT_1710652 [Flagelloscypha sp. PMI_526]|nr:hypothetical protein DL96DRAFT_1710652 [Flagelloscypha sp. PMI_526]